MELNVLIVFGFLFEGLLEEFGCHLVRRRKRFENPVLTSIQIYRIYRQEPNSPLDKVTFSTKIGAALSD